MVHVCPNMLAAKANISRVGDRPSLGNDLCTRWRTASDLDTVAIDRDSAHDGIAPILEIDHACISF